MDEMGVAPVAAAEEEIQTAETRKPGKDILDRTWDFFASVPVATVLLFVIAAASVGGSLIEQESMLSTVQAPGDYYAARYGPVMGTVLFKTGMTHMYSSWWYLTLLFMLGISLIICSLERFVPLWKAVQRPNPAPDEGFVRHLKNHFSFRPHQADAPMVALAEALKARRYRVVEKDGRLYADKGRWGRWGPYITHIGLILVLVGAMMRAIPGAYFDQFIWVRDGEIVKVPNTDFFIQSEKFVAEFYDSGAPKLYKTEARILDGEGKELLRHDIVMNEPLTFRWVELYQSSFKQELGKAIVSLNERESGKEIGTFELDLLQPKPMYEVGGYKIRVVDYFPDFGLDSAGKPTSKSSQVNNPGVVAEITTPDGNSFTNWYFVMYPEMEFDPSIPVKFKTLDMGVVSTTGLTVKMDLGVPVIYLGLLIVTLGTFATFYIPHRRYWAMVEGPKVLVGGWTNRNQGSLVSEMQRLGHALDPKTNPLADQMEGEER